MLKTIYIGSGCRTPFGAFGGVYANQTAAQLGSFAIKGVLERAGIEGKHLDEVLMGNVIQAGQGQNPARQASLAAGVPKEVGCSTINKVCGSGLRAAIIAAQTIQCGDGSIILAGGMESMTNAPYLLKKARTGYRMGHGEVLDSMIVDGLWDVYTNQHMATCGDKCAIKYGFSRESQDDYAIESYHRAIASWENGFFKKYVVPVTLTTKEGTTVVDKDEDVAKFRGADKLRALKSPFGRESMITAGNASGINDGAAAILVYDDAARSKFDLKPAAKILGHANAATDPDWFTIAPILAIQKLCQKLGLKPTDVDLYEINEAFAVVAQVAIQELGLDHKKVNIAGGSVAIGHPIGASGTRVLNTLVRALHTNDKKIGIACLCIGGGEASAVAIERLPL